MGSEVCAVSSCVRPRTQCFAEDFRSALHQASSCIKALHKFASSSSSVSPPHSPSSSTALNLSSDVDIDRARTDVMTQLTAVLKRNLRVRYEMNISDVVQA